MNFDTLTVACDDLCATVTRLSQYRNNIDQDFKSDDDRWHNNPLEYGPRLDVQKAAHNCKEDFVKFIIRELMKSDRFKNLIIDEDQICKQFGIGYGSIEKYGPGFKASNVVDCFNELWNNDHDDLETVIYNQILHTAKRSVRWYAVHKNNKIDRFGKNDTGIILSFCNPSSYQSSENYTSALIKLLFIKYSDVSPLSAKHIYVDYGQKFTKSDLPFCESMTSYQNGKLKIKFSTKERADDVCELLLGDPNVD